MEQKELGDWSLYQETVGLIVSQLEHSNSLIISAACLSLAELARCGPLPLAEDGKLSLLQRLLALVKSSKTNIRLRERAALAVGSLCLCLQHRGNLLESFIKLASDIKDIKLHFSIWEALVFCSLGLRSPASRDMLSVEEGEFSPLDLDLQGEEGETDQVRPPQRQAGRLPVAAGCSEAVHLSVPGDQALSAIFSYS